MIHKAKDGPMTPVSFVLSEGRTKIEVLTRMGWRPARYAPLVAYDPVVLSQGSYVSS